VVGDPNCLDLVRCVTTYRLHATHFAHTVWLFFMDWSVKHADVTAGKTQRYRLYSFPSKALSICYTCSWNKLTVKFKSVIRPLEP
jgi:hypothetical protein